MAEIFSGTSILRYELGLIGRASTNIIKVVLGLRAIVVHVATAQVAKSGPKYYQNLNGMGYSLDLFAIRFVSMS